MKTPIIIVNFKTYEQATGDNAVKLAKACENVAGKSGVNIMAAVQAADIYRVASSVKIPVLAQHVDSISYGKNTGHILPESAKQAGASGTLLNHAEHKIDYKTLADTINNCRRLKLITIVCAADNREAEIAAELGPDFIAVEPPELIGTGVSVSSAKPEAVTSSIAAVRKTRRIPVLCGAGISSGKDVEKALKLGTDGVLLASSVTTAKYPEAVLVELVKFL